MVNWLIGEWVDRRSFESPGWHGDTETRGSGE